jgi:DNA invertase Pin-like site-specific DNA recombinase
VDDGLSASTGAHIQKGKLGDFLRECDAGKHRNNALVVENFDRLSRLDFDETSELLIRLRKAGVTVHITQQNRVIAPKTDLTTAIMNAVESFAANEYSAKLKERIGKAWAKKKRETPDGIAMTCRLPAWLNGRTGERITVNEERAKVVRRIFEMSANGYGNRQICKILNDEGVEPFSGRGRKRNGGLPHSWLNAYVAKILSDGSAIGTYQPMKNNKPDGEPRHGYYPAVVDLGLWNKVREGAAQRKIKGFAGRTGQVRNLFSSIVLDADANFEPMYYVDKGLRSKPRLITKHSHGDSPNSLVYADFERGFLHLLDELDWVSVLDLSSSTELRTAEEEIGKLSLAIERAGSDIEKITDLLIDTPSHTLKARLLAAEERQRADQERLGKAKEGLEELRRKNRDMLDSSVAYSKLLADKSIETRTRLRAEIRRKVAHIDVIFGRGDGYGYVVAVNFVSGVRRIAIESGGKLFWQ